jgi:hypothetical protein
MSLADPDDAPREFVVSFYLEDDTLAIVEVLRDKKGAHAVRFLSRGKWRNANAAPDATSDAVQRAVNGPRGAIPLAPPAQAAYDRVFGASGDKFGYADSFGGQGYSGGVYGKSERTGPGNTGVAAAADIGVRDPLSHTFVAPPRLFSTDDFRVGAALALHHMPGVVFLLGQPDGFTEQWLAAREASHGDGAADARDVYVPDSKAPVPSLPLEGMAAPESAASAHTDACLTFGKVLAGVAASAQEVVRQSDKGRRGWAPRAVVAAALAKYGCAPPAVPADVVEYMLDVHTIGTGAELMSAEMARENAKSTKHARPGSRGELTVPGGSPFSTGRTMARTAAGFADAIEKTTGTSHDGLLDPLAGPRLTDYGARAFYAQPMVDYGALFKSVNDAVIRQRGLQPRLDKLLPQLRAALLSSRTHLRKIFRDLDTAGKGVITFKEFRHLLLRHQLDVGLNDAQIRAVMDRFEPADAAAAAAAGAGDEPAIAFTGFVRTLLDAATLAPGEVEHFMDFVRGVHNTAPESVGGTYTVPQVFPHTNKVSSWGENMDLSRFGVMDSTTRPFSAPSATAARPPPPPAASASARAPHAPVAPPPVPAAARTAPAATAAPVNATLSASAAPGHGRPSTAPAAAIDPRPRPANPVVDVVAVLLGSQKGADLLARVRSIFGTRRLDLYRSLTLYDTCVMRGSGRALISPLTPAPLLTPSRLRRRRTRALGVRAFLDALVSAGLKLTSGQVAELSKAFCSAAAAPGAPVPQPMDVAVDYNEFLESAFPQDAY